MFKLKNSKRTLPFSYAHRFPRLSSSSFSSTPQLLLLLSYYVNGEISSAQSLFKIHFKTNITSVNSTIKELSNNGSSDKILYIYHLLRISNMKPNNFTFPCAIKACTDLDTLEEGRSIHTHILKSGYGLYVVVGNSLIDLYSKFYCLQSARNLFDEMADRNLVSWNLILSCYRKIGFSNTLLELCSLMRNEGFTLDRVSMKIILPVCGRVRALTLGKSIHAHVITSGLLMDITLTTTVMDMYAKCGALDEAERLFMDIECKDVVCWNAMISGYSQNGKFEMVVEVFRKMIVAGISPSIVTVLLILQTCAELGVLQIGRSFHGCVEKLGLSSDISVQTLLIDMYSKCGELCSALWVFNGICRGTVNSWSSIIYCLGMHGYGEAALMAFFGMLKRGICPDDICFLLLLSACRHTGLVNEGCHVFNYMIKQFGIHPKMEHYVSMVDLFGRAGYIDKSFRFICQMPVDPDISVWGAFFGACKIHGYSEMGGLFREHLVESGSKKAGYYKLLLSIYASKGSWDDVSWIRRLMEERGVKRTTGFSLIEMNS